MLSGLIVPVVLMVAMVVAAFVWLWTYPTDQSFGCLRCAQNKRRRNLLVGPRDSRDVRGGPAQSGSEPDVDKAA